MKRGTVYSTSYQNGFLNADVRTYQTDIIHSCMVLTQFGGHLQSIEQGTEVIIDKTESNLWVVVGVFTSDADRFPDSIEKQDQIMSFDDGTKIEASYNGSGYDVNIEASGDVYIDAGGDVLIGDPAEAVAKQDHTHDYEDTGDTGDGTAGTSTKTTPTPNESGTNTKIE